MFCALLHTIVAEAEFPEVLPKPPVVRAAVKRARSPSPEVPRYRCTATIQNNNTNKKVEWGHRLTRTMKLSVGTMNAQGSIVAADAAQLCQNQDVLVLTETFSLLEYIVKKVCVHVLLPEVGRT